MDYSEYLSHYFFKHPGRQSSNYTVFASNARFALCVNFYSYQITLYLTSNFKLHIICKSANFMKTKNHLSHTTNFGRDFDRWIHRNRKLFLWWIERLCMRSTHQTGNELNRHLWPKTFYPCPHSSLSNTFTPTLSQCLLAFF